MFTPLRIYEGEIYYKITESKMLTRLSICPTSEPSYIMYK